LTDNACLAETERLGLEVLPFFCFEPSLLAADDTSDMHTNAQWQALSGLRTTLRKHNADVDIAHGEEVEKLAKLHALVPFTHLLSHEEVGNEITFRRDRAVAAWCQERGVVYHEFPQSSVRRGGVNRDRLQEMWRSRIVDARPLPVAAIHQSDAIRQLAAAITFPKLRAFSMNS
jgi:deoxyribodipyrimidine photo-lyase